MGLISKISENLCLNLHWYRKTRIRKNDLIR